MIIFGMPLFAWIGALTFLLIIIQVSLGIAMTKYQKNVLKYHKPLGIIILLLAIIHMALALLFLLKGIVI